MSIVGSTDAYGIYLLKQLIVVRTDFHLQIFFLCPLCGTSRDNVVDSSEDTAWIL